MESSSPTSPGELPDGAAQNPSNGETCPSRERKSDLFVYRKISPYQIPVWSEKLLVKPTHRVKLSMEPTPVHEWNLCGVPEGFQVFVKREDLAGSTLTGNKVRKLEFLLADALRQGCDTLVTFGGPLSNHTRATALAGREIGLQTHVIVLTTNPEERISCKGNFLLSRLAGIKVVIISPRTDLSSQERRIDVDTKTSRYVEKLKKEGQKPYVVPAGGSSAMGIWGYIHVYNELMEQGYLDYIDDIVVATGSGGTLCGLAVGKYLNKSSIGLHGVSIQLGEEALYASIDHQLQSLGIRDVKAKDLVDITSDYVELGFGRSTKEELDTVIEVISETGVSVDPSFTAKAVRGMLSEMKLRPQRFKGKRVLFINTGGIFGLFDGKIDHIVKKNRTTNQVVVENDS